MTKPSPRKTLSYLLALITAFSIVFAVFSGVNHLTLGSKNFYVRSFSTQTLADECDKQLTEKYKVLAVKSNLPLDVFDSVKVKFDTKQSLNQAAEFLFDENDETLKNGSRYDYFKNTIIEYTDANDIRISSETVDTVAKEAQQIYSDTVGIHNLGFLQTDMQNQSTRSVGCLSVCLLVLAFAAILLAYVYDKKIQFLSYFSSGIITGGVATILSSVAMKCFNIGAVSVSPTVWNTVFADMTHKILLFRILVGILVLLLGVALFLFSQHRLNREQMRKDTRYSKIFSKL